ncbi:MAG TPA: hypothetical protein VJ810_16515 [Blastocatellia bacterium]|nr:hypothetical protein [Blastocatellia bacterium]
MAQKSITLILLGADRELWNGGPIRLQVTNATRLPLELPFNKRLGPDPHTTLMNLDLLFDAGQAYVISVDVKKHRAAWQLINRHTFLRQQGGIEVEVKDIIMQLMLVPSRPKSSDLDGAYDRLREQGSPMASDQTGLTRSAYLDLKPAAKMAVLNIEAKLRETRLNGVQLLSFVEGVRHAAEDRLFLFMRSELKRIIEDSAEFASALGHKAPIGAPLALPDHPDSWKHRRFGAGNLQLAFSRATETLPGNSGRTVFSVDADIDLEKGLLHVFEVLDNHALHPGKKTDQTQVYALLFSQGIIPTYTLDPLSLADEDG